MKVKTISKLLDIVFKGFVESIEDLEVKKLVKENSIITGGCIASMLLGEKVNDYDIYFTNKETVKAVALYYVRKFNETSIEKDIYVIDGKDYVDEVEINPLNKSKGMLGLNLTSDRIKIVVPSKGVRSSQPNVDEEIEEFLKDSANEIIKEKSDKKYIPIFLSGNAITLSNNIQMIIRFYGSPEEIHKSYDFVHATNYWESKTGKLILNKDALSSLLTKELRYLGSMYPIASIIRARKFVKRGWSINAGQFLKMSMQISKLDLTNLSVLEDQLIGVDVAYFGMLIDALGDFMKHNPGKSIDETYIMEIIDKIF